MTRVSVIMPCYNHGRFVRQSSHSVLGQTHSDLELIIIDDSSKDDSWETVRSLADEDSRIRTIRHERNHGVSRSRNEGLQAATGDFIAFCDADDVWEPGKLEFQLKLIECHQGHDVVYGDSVIMDEAGRLTGELFSKHFPPPKDPSGHLFRHLVEVNFINTQTVLMRRQCLDEVHGFDEDLRVVEDWWFWIQLARTNRFIYSEQPLARYRVHSGSTCTNRRVYARSRFKVYRRILNRFPDLPVSARASLLSRMGEDLHRLHRVQLGRRMLWNALGLSVRDPRAFRDLCRTVRRIVTPFRYA